MKVCTVEFILIKYTTINIIKEVKGITAPKYHFFRYTDVKNVIIAPINAVYLK